MEDKLDTVYKALLELKADVKSIEAAIQGNLDRIVANKASIVNLAGAIEELQEYLLNKEKMNMDDLH